MSHPDKCDIVIAVPCLKGMVRMEWVTALTSLNKPMNTTLLMRWIPGQKIQDARNAAAKVTIEADAEYLFFLDDDVFCPPNGLRRMLGKLEQEPEWDMVSGIVPMKSEDPVEPNIYKDSSTGAYWDWSLGEFFEIDSCGMACTLIRRDALRKVKEPWFEWYSYQDGAEIKEVGEDIGFCVKLREAGGKLLADGGTLCAHADPYPGSIYQMDPSSAPFKTEQAAEYMKRNKPILEEVAA